MPRLEKFVSIHPYFRIHLGKVDAFRALLPAFHRLAATEIGTLFFEFTVNGLDAFCREAYADGESALVHIRNFQGLLAEAAKVSDVVRFEIHGPAGELAKLKSQLPGLQASWFALETDV
jgi:hypothetical protein